MVAQTVGHSLSFLIHWFDLLYNEKQVANAGFKSMYFNCSKVIYCNQPFEDDWSYEGKIRAPFFLKDKMKAPYFSACLVCTVMDSL